MQDLMIDLETMGLAPDGAIVAIGAVNFELATGETGDSFEVPVSLNSSYELGMKLYPSTVLWWFGRDPEALASWKTDRAVPITTALAEFEAWFERHSQIKRVWANAPTFDLMILRRAYELVGGMAPWPFRRERCVRTLLQLAKDLGTNPRSGWWTWHRSPGGTTSGTSSATSCRGARNDAARTTTAHSALDDCYYQIEYCHLAWQMVERGTNL
jgi:hypothetical protein